MRRIPVALIVVAGLFLSVLGAERRASGGDCGCGGPPPGCCAPPVYVHSHCHPWCHHCGPYSRRRDRDATRYAEPDYRASAPVPVVSSMPVFSTPLMLASVPVVPTTVSRSAAPEMPSLHDCNRRLDRLEDNVKELANAMSELQTIVKDQTRALAEITRQLKENSP